MDGVGADCVGELLSLTLFRYVSHTMGQARQQVVPHVVRIWKVVALGVSVEQRTSFYPVFVGGVDLKSLGSGTAGLAALTPSGRFTGYVIGQHLMGEGKDAFRVQVILPVALGSSRLGEPEVDLISAAAPGMAKYPVEDPLTVQVFVEPQLLKVVQGA